MVRMPGCDIKCRLSKTWRQRSGGTYSLGCPVETSHSKVIDEAVIGTSCSWREVEVLSGYVPSSRWDLARA